MSPTLEELPHLKQPLEPGERLLVEKLNDSLPMDWEIYVQPHLNGLCPDIVLLNPFVGIVIIEVKDWNFSAMNYHWEVSTKGSIKTLLATKDGKTFRVENPLEKAKLYSYELQNLYCPSVGDRGDFAPVVSSLVFFSKLSTRSAKQFVRDGFGDTRNTDRIIDSYYPAIGGDALDSDLSKLIPFFAMTRSKYMREEHASDLRLWLEEPRSKKDQRTPVNLSQEQRKLVEREPTNNGFRRIRGSAGSGKSLVLASKAAVLALQGKKVLIVSYNITLGNYLGDLVARAALPKSGVRNRVVFLNYHLWARRVCISTGNVDRYDALDWKGDFDGVLKYSLPVLVDSILKEGCPKNLTYDAVLVDEGQDFELLWWQSLTRVVRGAGEAILVADKTQDLYESASVWTDDAMKSAGFRGPWNELKVSFRLPSDYLPFMRDFLERFITDDEKIEPQPVQSDLAGITKTQMRWLQVTTEATSMQACVDAVLHFPIRERVSDDNATYPDVVVLTGTNRGGFQIVKELSGNGIKVRHTFGSSDERQDKKEMRKQKMAFYLGAEQVKATTIHSFKGWESTCLVVQIIEGASKSAIAAVYTALTRLKASERGGDSYITVVCSAPEFEDYGKTWPEFTRL